MKWSLNPDPWFLKLDLIPHPWKNLTDSQLSFKKAYWFKVEWEWEWRPCSRWPLCSPVWGNRYVWLEMDRISGRFISHVYGIIRILLGWIFGRSDISWLYIRLSTGFQARYQIPYLPLTDIRNIHIFYQSFGSESFSMYSMYNKVR